MQSTGEVIGIHEDVRVATAKALVAAALVPLAILVAALWTGVLALVNVRQRSVEIGILRAIGLRSGQVFRVFVAKAAVVAAIGAMVGLAGGLSVAIFAAVRGSMAAATALSWPTIAATAAGAVVVCCLASWAPATLAARQDPAAILAKE